MALKEKGIAAEFLSSTKTANAKDKVNYRNAADILFKKRIYIYHCEREA